MIINIIGLQYGDEGKGKISRFLTCPKTVSVRYNGGPNAKHTIGESYRSQIPSGFGIGKLSLILATSYVDLDKLFNEWYDLRIEDKIIVSNKAHVIGMEQRLEDDGLHSTRSGIAPAASQKYNRFGTQFKDTYALCQELKGDADKILFDEWKKGSRIIMEGAQGFYLDIDHGDYPFVTSSNTTTAYLPYTRPDYVIGCFKPFETRVLDDHRVSSPIKNQEEIKEKLNMDFIRQVGELDIERLKWACEFNNIDFLACVGLDLIKEEERENFIKDIENVTGIPVAIISDNKSMKGVYFTNEKYKKILYK